MANCINCGVKLSALNESYPLWDATEIRFCNRCREKAKRFLKHHKMDFGNRNITQDFISSNIEFLMGMGFSENGIQYLLDYAGVLTGANAEHNKNERLEEAATQREQEEWKHTEGRRLQIYLLKATTGYNFEGYVITNYIGILSAEVVLGTDVFSTFSAGVSDIYESESNAAASKITMAKASALRKLKEKCYDAGANAIIGVDFDMMTIEHKTIVVCANGTAVKISETGE